MFDRTSVRVVHHATGDCYPIATRVEQVFETGVRFALGSSVPEGSDSQADNQAPDGTKARSIPVRPRRDPR